MTHIFDKNDGNQLAATIIQAMEELVEDFDYVDLASTLVSAAINLLTADAVGVMVGNPSGALQVVAASDEEMRTLEVFEIQANEGPCLDSWATGDIVMSPNLEDEDRWPMFCTEAMNRGFQSAAAAPLRLRDMRFGSLNVLWKHPHLLTERQEQAMSALADLAALGLTSRAVPTGATLLAEQIQFTIAARTTIEQAKGMIAEQASTDMNSAYNLMRNFSRITGEHLVDVARKTLARKISAAQMQEMWSKAKVSPPPSG